MRTRLRRLPFAAGIGVLACVAAPYGRWLWGAVFALAVFWLPDLLPLLGRFRRVDPPGRLRRPGERWRHGTVQLVRGGVRFVAHETVVDLRPERWAFAGFLLEDRPEGHEVLVLRSLSDEVHLAVAPDVADRAASGFRLWREQ